METERELTSLQKERRELELPEPTKEEVKRWSALEALIDRRTLSWTRLLSVLEGVVPPDVRLTTIMPRPTGDGFEIDVAAMARTDEAALSFLQQLEAHPEIDQVLPNGITEAPNGSELRCSLRYRPAPDAAPAAGPPAGPEPESEPPPEEEP
jgi:hypothetical protein